MRNSLTKDTMVSLGVAVTLAGAVWWAATIDARTRNVEEKVQPIPAIQQDIAFIKAKLEGPNSLSARK